MCPTLMWGKLCGKSLLVEVLKSEGGVLNVGNPTNLFVLVDVSMCTFRIAVYGRLKYVVT